MGEPDLAARRAQGLSNGDRIAPAARDGLRPAKNSERQIFALDFRLVLGQMLGIFQLVLVAHMLTLHMIVMHMLDDIDKTLDQPVMLFALGGVGGGGVGPSEIHDHWINS